MKNFNLISAVRKLKETKLSQDEKRDMLARILQKPASVPIKSPFSTSFNFQSAFPKGVAYALAAVLLVVGGMGTSYAAEKSIPGDALYPIKIRVNEPIKGVLAVKKEAKIEWEAVKAERRIAEARELASQGRLDAVARKDIETNFNLHAEKFREISNDEKNSGKIDKSGKDNGKDKDKEIDSREKVNERLRDKFEAGIEAETGKLELIKDSSADIQKHEIQELENTVKEKMQKVKRDKKK